MSQHPLQRRINALRSRLLRLLLVRGASAVVASVVAAVVTLGVVDYAIRFRDRGVLVIFAASVLAVFGWTVFRFLSRLRRARWSDIELALQVESCFPAARDRLASAVEFLHQAENDAAAGSALMRRTAIAQATAQCDPLDFSGVLNWRPAFRTALGALIVCLLAAGLVLLNPAAARTALARLARPLGSEVWPQRTHLAVKSPARRIARGQPLEVEVVDAFDARLPADCRIHYRLRDARGKLSEESEPMRPLGGAMLARRENLTRSLEFRVTGGDDQSMPWRTVEVLDPPAVNSLTVEVSPPAYTSWPRENRDAASTLPILAGSHVQLSGEASKPLRSAMLHLEGGRDVATRIESDGRHFRVGGPSTDLPEGLVLEKPAAYAISLVDRDGIRGSGESWQFRVQSDAPPSVVIERPKTNLFVTPRARVDLIIKAGDDLGLRQVALVYSSSGATALAETTLPLFAGPERPAPRGDAAFTAAGGEQRSIAHRWDLEELNLLSGAQLTAWATAADYRGQIVRSDPRTFSIITTDELQERLAARQSQILAELARLLQAQRDDLGRVRGLAIRLHETGGLDQREIERLQAAEFNQREIVRGLTDRNDGLWGLVAGVLADLETNRVDNPDFARRMQGILDTLAALQREQFPSISDELTTAIQTAQARLQAPAPAPPRDAGGEAHLTRAGDCQQQVVDALENLLSQLRQWDDYRRFQRDVAQLLRDQEDVARGAADLGRRTVGRDAKEFSPDESADLKVLVERQFELVRREQRIEQEMEQTIVALRPGEPLAADTLDDALAEARRLAIAVTMANLSGQVRGADLGLAHDGHQKILQDLQSVLDILANNRAQEDERLGRALDQAAHDLEELRSRQEALRRKFDELVHNAAQQSLDDQQKAELQRLAREQEELRQEALRMGRRLERLLADQAGEDARRAGKSMNDAADSAKSGQPGAAGQRAKEAEGRLGEAVSNLDTRRMELKVKQAIDQQARLEDAIKHLRGQEERIGTETREFAAIERAGPLTRGQEFGLLELARQQVLLREETDRLAQSLAENNVFREGLLQAETGMRRAAELLKEHQTGPPTQQAEQAAIARLATLLAAFAADDDAKAKQDDVHNSGPNMMPDPKNQKGPGGPQRVVMLSEIKAVKLWQEDLNRRTRQTQMDSAGKPPDELRGEYAQLADEQGRLAAAAFQLLGTQKTAGDAPQDGANEKEKKPNDADK